MQDKSTNLTAIPTNIISGFLGVGKTSAILSLLDGKPDNERWAVLVNEFGEIGIDGSFFKGEYGEPQGVFVREVPGGCMCCAAGLPMQIALNQLLAKARPHRLLIEPTGLGHPKEVLEVLSAEHYQDVLNIQKNITLVDARKLTDIRYTLHDTFNQQIDIADVVIGNKVDLYQKESKQILIDYVANRRTQMPDIAFTQHGKLAPAMLTGASEVVHRMQQSCGHHHAHGAEQNAAVSDKPLPESGVIKIANRGEGFESVGWRFSPHKLFNRQALQAWFARLDVERLKAVMITTQGIFSYNLVDGAMTEKELDDCLESRIEIIASKVDNQWEDALLACQTDTESTNNR